MEIAYKALINISAEITVKGTDAKEVIKELAFWQSLPLTFCPVKDCGKTLIFFYRSPQGNDYFGLRCLGEPSHQINFGQNKNADKTLYFDDKKNWTVWLKGEAAQVEDKTESVHSSEPPQGKETETTKTPEEIKALNLFNSKKVAKVDGGYNVDGEKVYKDNHEKTCCTCGKFKNRQLENSFTTFQCEHILAVKLFAASLKKQAA